MNRVTILGVALALAMIPCLAGCGSGKPKATTSKSSSPSPTPTSSTPSPTATAQPKGKYGVTIHLTNWKKYSSQPVVVSYKRAMEALLGSINSKSKKIAPDTTRLLTKKMQRTWLKQIHTAWINTWHVPAKGTVRIQSASPTGTVVACEWTPSVSYYTTAGRPVDHTPRNWARFVTHYTEVGGTWKLSGYEFKGTCKGGAPR